MSSQIRTQLRDMSWEDVDAVLNIEQQVHRHPWTRGNFNDALATGNICKVVEAANEIIGYAVMNGVEWFTPYAPNVGQRQTSCRMCLLTRRI